MIGVIVLSASNKIGKELEASYDAKEKYLSLLMSQDLFMIWCQLVNINSPDGTYLCPLTFTLGCVSLASETFCRRASCKQQDHCNSLRFDLIYHCSPNTLGSADVAEVRIDNYPESEPGKGCLPGD